MQPVKPIRILIAEDLTGNGRAIASIAAQEPDFELVAASSDGARILSLARRRRPDILLIDLLTPGLDGLTLLRKILHDCPPTQGIVLGDADCQICLFDALYAGAQTYLAHDAEDHEVLGSIRAVARGGSLLAPRFARTLIDEWRRLRGIGRTGYGGDPAEALTERENDIIQLVAEGLGNREIADVLNLAEGTIKNYVSRILEKLHARSRTELVVKAFRLRYD